jgi:hypothetical protein
MGKALLIAGIAMLASGGPAAAKPDHARNGKSTPPAVVDNGSVGYGVGGCPPGLKKKNELCMPPGRYKKLFEVGQRVPKGYDGLRSYSALPTELRMRHGGALDPQARYIYDQQYLYRVDPTTMVVHQILRSLL